MYDPVATYRIQLHKEFNFSQLLSVLDYLQELGAVTLYTSPIFTSVPGSTHGYDGLQPDIIDPEIGDMQQLEEIAAKLKEKGMGWLQDIVPNHMAFDCRNPWLMDVLEKGERSRYRKYFDILEEVDKLMVPFLGSSVEEAIEKNELQIDWHNDRLVVKYFDTFYPLAPASYAQAIRLSYQDENTMQIALRIDELPEQGYSEEWEEILRDLAALRKSGEIKIDGSALNADKEILKHILDHQNYRLCHWKETDLHINYRRFFTVNGLICMNAQDPEVFADHHRLIRELTEKNIFQGLRVDHADGLYDPKGYLDLLRKIAGDETYITVEKILGKDEVIPQDWPIQGNTGYDYLSMINNLLVDNNGEKALTRFYSGISKCKQTIQQQTREKKAMILHHHMQGELNNLFALFCQLQLAPKEEVDNRSAESLKTVIGSMLVNLPVYRFYGSPGDWSDDEENAIHEVFRLVQHTEPEHKETAIWLENILMQSNWPTNDGYLSRLSHFYKRLMQFSGPLMAKGVEDTLMYTYNRLLSRNEVGDSPEIFGIDASKFHSLMIRRWEGAPMSMNATATHDTKRGEDARARLNVISDIPGEWVRVVSEWMQMNASLKTNGIPDANDEYMIYQAILGSYPLEHDDAIEFSERLKKYLQKALREAKTNSNWSEPDEEYEENVFRFAEALLDKVKPFWKSFRSFLERIEEHGVVNSLVQLVAKFTSPGVPDIYQGGELWDLSFVDPDNRRPVDYEKRKEFLQQVKETREAGELWRSRDDGRIKLWLTHKLLTVRKVYKDIFTAGEYIPLSTVGKHRDNIIAYGRKMGDVMLIVVLPLHTAALTNSSVSDLDWLDTKVLLPAGTASDAEELLTGESFAGIESLSVNELFRHLPFSVIRIHVKSGTRKAGVLLHITSLPSPFGIGDLGPEARKFADILHRSAQRIWQVLPLNPTTESQAHSPYSATSSMAGNPLLISPELLVADGLLDPHDLQDFDQDQPDRISFSKVRQWKHTLFLRSWERFQDKDQSAFNSFCEKEDSWLHDFALFTFLKEIHGGRSWDQWQKELMLRERKALEQISSQYAEKIAFIKWSQFVFQQQWSALKLYVNKKGINIVGDLPFYVSYDSADVWVNRELFALNENGEILSVAGVPPDAFSDNGQLWGMPVFNWQKLRETNYKWWVDRIRKNCELFDSIRLDHFRAFSAYWEVDGKQQTAKNGKWVDTPGKELFEKLRSALGDLPFIAEDLGDIDDAVRQLRREFQLPGMKVLQFAFGDDLGSSEFMPHHHERNFVVYTGTHDNNTVNGWWVNEADEDTKRRVNDHAGYPLTKENVADHFCRLAYSSVADQVIIPAQDLLGLGNEARMNTPSSVEDNWTWRLLPGQLTPLVEMKLRKWTRLYNR